MNNNLPFEVLLPVKAYLARYYHVPKEITHQPNNEIIKVRFTHPVLGNISVPSILHSRRARSKMPLLSNFTKNINVIYTYDRHFSAKVINRTKFLSSMKNIQHIQRELSSHGDCEASLYKYNPCGHVVTGNLDIVHDTKLRNLLKKEHNTGFLLTETTTKLRRPLQRHRRLHPKNVEQT